MIQCCRKIACPAPVGHFNATSWWRVSCCPLKLPSTHQVAACSRVLVEAQVLPVVKQADAFDLVHSTNQTNTYAPARDPSSELFHKSCFTWNWIILEYEHCLSLCWASTWASVLGLSCKAVPKTRARLSPQKPPKPPLWSICAMSSHVFAMRWCSSRVHPGDPLRSPDASDASQVSILATDRFASIAVFSHVFICCCFFSLSLSIWV